MRIGKQVVFYFKGTHVPATVTALGPSGATGKVLNLSFDGGTAENVAHGADHAPDEPFWLLEGEEEPGSTSTPVARRRAVRSQ